MAKILRPRRGSASTAKSQLTGNNKLLRGEIFFELPTAGIGKDEGKIIIGDGTTDYGSLVAFIDPAKYLHNGKISDEIITFTETSNSDTNSVLNSIISGNNLKTLFSGIKNALSNMNSSMSTMNSDLSKAKEDILYHWDQIENKVSITTESKNTSGSKYNLPPFAVIRSYCNESVTIKANDLRFVYNKNVHLENKEYTNSKLSDLQSYILSNTNNEYLKAGAIGAFVGQTSNGVPLKCSIVQFSASGIRLWNNTSSSISTPDKMTFSGNSSSGYKLEMCPPYIDCLFIRKDILSYIY